MEKGGKTCPKRKFFRPWEKKLIRYDEPGMGNQNPDKKEDITIRNLYPGLNEEQLKEAEENLERYLELSIRIYERILNDPQAYSTFRALTASRQTPMIKGKRSTHNDTNSPA